MILNRGPGAGGGPPLRVLPRRARRARTRLELGRGAPVRGRADDGAAVPEPAAGTAGADGGTAALGARAGGCGFAARGAGALWGAMTEGAEPLAGALVGDPGSPRGAGSFSGAGAPEGFP